MKEKLVFVVLLYFTFCKSQTSPNYSVYGVFNVEQVKYASINSTTLSTNNLVSAYFTDNPTATIFIANRKSAGKVAFNYGSLSYVTTDSIYKNNNVSSINSMNWDVDGDGNIPNLSFSYEGEMPFFDIGETTITDTLFKSDTLLVNIAGLERADSVNIILFDNNSGTIYHQAALKAPNYSTAYRLPPSIYSDFVAGYEAVIKIEAVNYTYQTLSDKQFLFRNIYSCARSNIVIVE